MLQHLTRRREAIRQFPVSFFSITMGTGIVSVMLGRLPTHPAVCAAIGQALWYLNIVLFAFCSIAFIARVVIYPQTVRALLNHPIQSMFLGMIPMGFSTIVNGLILYQPQAAATAYFLWWFDVVLAILSGILVPYCMFTTHKHSLDKMSAIWLLPIVPAEVAAASGGVLVQNQPAYLAPLIIDTSFLLWTLSVPLMLGILTLLLLRLAVHGLPPKELAISNWLTLGPLGTGCTGILLIAAAVKQHLAVTPEFAEASTALALFVGMTLWGYGLWWGCIAMLTTIYHAKLHLPFNIGWWGLTFPIGVYAGGTLTLGYALHAQFFLTLGTIFTAVLVLLWLFVTLRTLPGLWHGYLFHDPSVLPEE